MIHLNEFRALRDGYGKKAVAALTRRFPGSRQWEWAQICAEAKIIPPGTTDTLLIWTRAIGDIGDWSAITRFCWLCDLVWEMEVAELAKQNANKVSPEKAP